MTIQKDYVRLGLGLLGFIFIFEILKCSIDHPKAPSWDLPINISLVDKKYTIAELIDEYEELFITDNGMLGLRFDGNFDTTFVANRLRLPDVTETVDVDFRNVDIPFLGERKDWYSFSQLWEDAESNNGRRVIVPQFTFTDVAGNPAENPDFYFASLRRGRARIVVRNNLPVPLNDLILTYMDQTNSSQITRTFIASVASMDSAAKELDFGGVVIPRTSVWVMSGTSPGSSGATVSVDHSATVEIETELLDVLAEKVTARIPPLKINQEKMLDFGAQAALYEAHVSSGMIILDVANSTPLETGLDITLSQITHLKTGAPLNMSVRLSPYQQSEKITDLSNYRLRMNPEDDHPGTETPLDVVGDTEASYENYLTLAPENRIVITVSLADIVLEYISGVVQQQEVPLDTLREEIDLPDYVEEPGTFNFDSGRMEITFINSINVPIKFDGEIIGHNLNDQRESVVLVHALNHRTTILPESTIIILDENDNIANFINLPPIRIDGVGSIWIGDGVTVGEVSANDFIYGAYRFETAANAQWETTSFNADTSEIRILPEDGGDDKNDDDVTTLESDVTKRLQSVKVFAQLENHLPVGASVRFFMHTDSSVLFAEPMIVLGPVQLKVPPTDNNGRVSQALTQEQELSLSPEDSEIFKNVDEKEKSVYIGTEVTLQGTNGRIVKVYSDDYLQVQAMATIVVRMGGERD